MLSLKNSFAKFSRRFCKSSIRFNSSELRNKIGSHKSIGLLTSITDIKEANHYSNNINIQDYISKEAKDEKNIFKVFMTYWNGDLLKFDQNLTEIIKKATTFVESKELWNREEIKSELDTILNGKSNFVCFLAGKSTGKSLIVKNFQNQYKEKVFVVNLRQNLNMLEALIDTLRKNESEISIALKKFMIDSSTNVVEKITFETIKAEHLRSLVNYSSESTEQNAFSKLVNQLISKLGVITLIIDEANLALNISDRTSMSDILVAKQALALFTTLTKEERKVFDKYQ